MKPDPLYTPTLALEPYHCRAPVNAEGEPYTFCGHNKLPGSSYCPYHAERFEYASPRRPAGHFKLYGQAVA